MLSDHHRPGISLPSLSDEAAVEVLDFLLDFLRLFESITAARSIAITRTAPTTIGYNLSRLSRLMSRLSDSSPNYQRRQLQN
jgi:hypothetical protein